MIPYKWFDYLIAILSLALMIAFTIISCFTVEVGYLVGTICSAYIGGVYMGFRTQWLER